MIKYLVVKDNKYVWKRNPDILNNNFEKRVKYPHFEIEQPKAVKRLWGMTGNEGWAYAYSDKKEALRVAANIAADKLVTVEV